MWIISCLMFSKKKKKINVLSILPKDKTLLLPWNWKYRPSENFEIRLSRKHFSEELLISYKNYNFSFQFPAIKTFSSQTFFVPLLITKTSATIFTKYLLRKLHMSGSCFQVQKETGVRYAYLDYLNVNICWFAYIAISWFPKWRYLDFLNDNISWFLKWQHADLPKSRYYLFHTYVPTCLIVIMSWISFWIKPEVTFINTIGQQILNLDF